MPQIYRYFGLIFYFWSDDHLPAHIHVTDGERETIFELILENSVLVEMRMRTDEKPPLKREDINSAKAFINVYYPQIIKKWFQFFVCGERIKTITIRKRVSDIVQIDDTVKHLEELRKTFYTATRKQAKIKNTKSNNSKNRKK